jgi:hypothetical protein
MPKKALILMLGLLAAVLSGPAQDVTGNLEGHILDAEGGPIGGAAVIVSGAGLQGERATHSDAQGYFRLLALPTGLVQVKVQHPAFQDMTIRDVAIRLGRTTSMGEIRLPSKSQESREIVVTAERPVVDPTSSTVGANLTADAIRSPPVARNCRNLMSLLPSANQSYYGDEVNVSGATGSENMYFIDGIDVSDPYRRYKNANLPYNFIKEIEVKRGGYAAEYRSSLGGLVNAVTYSGGNTFQGQVFGFFTGNRYSPDSFRPELEPGSGAYAQYDYGFSLGGPIIRDKLWFYGAFNPTTEREDVLIPGLGYFKDRLSRNIFAGKITWQPTSRANFVFTVLGDPARHDAVGGVAATAALNADPLLSRIEEGGVSYLASGSYMLGESSFLEASLAYVTRRDVSRPGTAAGGSQIFFADQAEGDIVSGGHVGVDDERSFQLTAAVKATFVLGRHVVKAGFEYRDNKLDSYQDRKWLFGMGDSGYILQINKGDAVVHNRIPSLFVQDSWSVSDRLQINAGLRWSGELLVASNGRVAQRILDEYQPRIGFVFLPGGSHAGKISGSYGRFYQEFSTLLLTWYQSENFLFQWIDYDHDPRLDFSGGVVGSEWVGSIMPEIEGLQGQNFDEFTLGYEQAIGKSYKIGLTGIYRHLRNGIEDGDDPEGGGGYGNPGRPPLQSFPKLKRDYYGLELTLAKIGSGPLQFAASYVLSRSYGNYPGLFAQDLGDPRPNVSGQFDSVEEVLLATGLLPNDRPHVFKAYGSYRFEFGFSLGAFFMWQSGTPLSEMGTQTMIPGWIKFLTTRGAAGRTPSIADLNVRAAYEMKPIRGTNITPRIILDVFHIGSQRTPVTYNQRRYFGVDDEGRQTDLNPLYLHATGYFPPMSARMGIEVRF